MVRYILLLLVSFMAFGWGPAGAANPVIPGNIRVDSGYDHIGVVWEISGDDNLNSQMTLEFRPQGSGAWQPAALAMRAICRGGRFSGCTMSSGSMGRNSIGRSTLG